MPFFGAACPWSLKESLGSSTTPSHLIKAWGVSVSDPRHILRLAGYALSFWWVKSTHWLLFLSNAAPWSLPHRSSRLASICSLLVTSSAEWPQ